MYFARLSSVLVGLTILQNVAGSPRPIHAEGSGARSTSDVVALAVAEGWKEEARDITPSFHGSSASAALAERTGNPNGVEKRWFGAVVQFFASGAQWAFFMGLGHLFAIAGAGQAILQNFGLIQGALNGVFAIWSRGFALTGGLRVRSEYGDMPVYGIISRELSKRSDGELNQYWTRLESHIPVGQDTDLQQAAIEANNSTDFLHIATVYHQGVATYTLHYRRAHPDDLGFENTGEYHHARAAAVPGADIAARAEVNNNGVVMDYLWKNGNQREWSDTASHAASGSLDQAAASTTTHFMQDHGSEVSCADVIVANYGSANEQGYEGPEDTGIVAFGWNNQPFAFNGRSGGWLNQCANPLN